MSSLVGRMPCRLTHAILDRICMSCVVSASLVWCSAATLHAETGLCFLRYLVAAQYELYI